MSRVASIRRFEDIAEEAESNLSNEIHRVFKPDTKVDYQVGLSEHPSSWAPYTVVGPHDKFKIVIRAVDREGKTFADDVTIDARSYRLRLTKEES